jgi:hypothetical protein
MGARQLDTRWTAWRVFVRRKKENGKIVFSMRECNVFAEEAKWRNLTRTNYFLFFWVNSPIPLQSWCVLRYPCKIFSCKYLPTFSRFPYFTPWVHTVAMNLHMTCLHGLFCHVSCPRRLFLTRHPLKKI